MKLETFPEISEYKKFSDFESVFLFKNLNFSLINSIRRSIVNEVPTISIDLVFMEINTSPFHDEFISHRLGLLPLFHENTNDLKYSPECQCTAYCRLCSLFFQINFIATENTKCVFSTDLVEFSENNYFLKAKNFQSSIVLTKMNKGQSLKLSCVAKKGIGKIHAKWSPVSNLKIKTESNLKINLKKLNVLTGIVLKKKIANQFNNFFILDKPENKLKLNNSRFIDWNFFSEKTVSLLVDFLLKEKIDPLEILLIDCVKKNFYISIESTGSLVSKSIIKSAIFIIKQKLNFMGVCIEKST